MTITERVKRFQAVFDRLHAEIRKIIVGQDAVIDSQLTCLFADGHCLMEGAPGLGKTLLVRTLSQVTDLEFKRIQFTPDLMPADITGTTILVEDEEGRRLFQLQKGPVFAHLVLADEINRASPRTQSALLESMQERRVTIGRGVHELPRPFLVMATQNPIEMEGTYPLPEAQLDRFLLKIVVGHVEQKALAEVVDRTTGKLTPSVSAVATTAEILEAQETVRMLYVAPHVAEWAGTLTWACSPDTRLPGLDLKRYIRNAVSPRGTQALILCAKVHAAREGRYNVSHDDVNAYALPALRHRMGLTYEAAVHKMTADQLIERLLEHVTGKRMDRLGIS